MATTTDDKLSLVDDEVLNLSSRPWVDHRYRFRVWRGEDISVVLMEPASPDAPFADLYSARAANLVTRSFLAFSGGRRFGWYERSPSGCFYVKFCRMGSAMRPMLCKPAYFPVDFPKLAARLGIDPEERLLVNPRKAKEEDDQQGDEPPDDDFQLDL